MHEPNGQPASAPGGDQKRNSSFLSRAFSGLLKHVMLAAVGFALAGAFIFVLADTVVMPLLLKSGGEIVTPDLMGVPLEDAETTLVDLGLRINPDSSAYNNHFPANTVSFQYPYPGTKVKPGRRVRVNISLGPRPLEMPSVVGKSRRDAELILGRYGLAVTRYDWVHSDDYVRNIVARQEPEGGIEAPENAEVVLYIADGEPETNAVMPELIGLGLSAALDSLDARGFIRANVRTHTEQAPQLLPETIIDQHPDPGDDTSTDVIIDLIISTTQ